MKSQVPPWLRVLAASLVLAAASGCASTPSSHPTSPTGARPHAAAGGQSLASGLRVGMAPAHVRQVLGNPAEVRPVEASGGKSERWIYRRRVDQMVDQVPTGTQDVPYVDPLTGQMRMIPEPVYSQVRTTVTEELHIVWTNGVVTSWKTVYQGDRSYSD